MPVPKTYKTKAAAEYLGISRDALESLSKKGIIPRFKMGGPWLYSESDLDDYYRARHAEGERMAAAIFNGKGKFIRIRKNTHTPATREDVKRWCGLTSPRR